MINWKIVNLIADFIGVCTRSDRQYGYCVLAKHPRLYDFTLGKVYVPPDLEMLVSSSTDIVVEGMPRCSNTFSSVYIKLLVNESLSLAHHIHYECQLRRARVLGKPCLVLIRRPEEAIRSWIIMENGLSVDTAVKSWYSYYRYLVKNNKDFTILDFDRAINAPDTVFKIWLEKEKLDQHICVDLTTEDVRRNIFHYDGEFTNKSKLPNEAKDAQKRALDFSSLNRGLRKRLSSCNEMYERLRHYSI